MSKTLLSNITDIEVRFNETDSMGIVWHGNYLIYFEIGRNDFGKDFGITYLDIQAEGFTAPIVQSICNYKHPIKFGDIITIHTKYIPTESAKLIFKYLIYNQLNKLVCTGETTQVFLDKNNQLSLISPKFYQDWKKNNLE